MRIAHITDTHLRYHLPGSSAVPVRRSRQSPELLAEALADARKRKADVAVLTGDIVDVPQWLDLASRSGAADQLWQQAREDYRLVRRILDGCGLPWISVPGNHDSYLLHRQELESGPYIRDIGSLRFVSFCDSESRGNVPRRTLNQRLRFESSLIDPGNRPQVHLQHFVISPRLDEDYPYTYEEGDSLKNSIVDSKRVALVLSGHYHPGTEPFCDGQTTFSVTPALSEYPHRYRIFDVSTSDERWSVGSQEVDLVPSETRRKTVFLDRDGCITEHPTYHQGPEALRLLPGAAPALRLLREHGYALVVVTNQSCVGLGHVEEATLDAVHDRMATLLAEEGAEVDAIYSSLSAGDLSVIDRYNAGDQPKPSPQMILRAESELHLDLSSSYLIGDRSSDMDSATAAGVVPILVRTGAGRLTERDHPSGCVVVDDIAAAAATIIRNDLNRRVHAD